MKVYVKKTLKEIEWNVDGDRLHVFEAMCNFCGNRKICGSFDSASKEYGTIEICKACFVQTIKEYVDDGT